MRVRPVRPLSGGREFHVGDMLTAIEQSTLKALAESIQTKDQPRFIAAYKQQLASCFLPYRRSGKATPNFPTTNI